MSFFTREAEDTPAPTVQEMIPGEGALHARFKTSRGEMVAELYEERVPRTVANFVALATGGVEWMSSDGPTERPLYSGTVFHRRRRMFAVHLHLLLERLSFLKCLTFL